MKNTGSTNFSFFIIRFSLKWRLAFYATTNFQVC